MCLIPAIIIRGKINLEVETSASDQLDASSFSTRQPIKTCCSVWLLLYRDSIHKGEIIKGQIKILTHCDMLLSLLNEFYRKAWNNFCTKVTALLRWRPPEKQKPIVWLWEYLTKQTTGRPPCLIKLTLIVMSFLCSKCNSHFYHSHSMKNGLETRQSQRTSILSSIITKKTWWKIQNNTFPWVSRPVFSEWCSKYLYKYKLVLIPWNSRVYFIGTNSVSGQLGRLGIHICFS